MNAKQFTCAIFSFCFALGVAAQGVTQEKVAQLALQFLPDPVQTMYKGWGGHLDLVQSPLEQIQMSERNHQGSINYLSFQMAGDPAQYVLLAWGGNIPQASYLRLLKSTDGGKSFTIAQDLPYWYQPVGWVWSIRLQDITGDGIPELLLESGDDMLVAFAWRHGAFVCITPMEEGRYFPPGWSTAFHSNAGVELVDADGNGKAEVVVYGWRGNERDDPKSDKSFHTVFYGTTKIYKYNGTSYVLWKELPADDLYPISVPSLAVLHPGTIPLAELSSPDDGDLRVFVSHPAGTDTVDDMEAGAFAFKSAKLDLKKRWGDLKQTELASANWEWGGCPVKQTQAKGQGDWSPSPEDPFLPSPDGTMEFHFLVPYLELRVPKSAVYPMLLQQATAAFAKEPSRQTYFISVPISGKMKNGKLATIGAMVCIKKTGSVTPGGSSPATAVPPPATPENK
jgi:hypothetical protein